MAEGGDVQPGRAYIVGEKRPELFMPRSAGSIVPSLAMSDGGKRVNVTNHFNIQTPDPDSFRKSSAQLKNHMSRVQQAAMAKG